jgi:hypothetical protein
MNIRKIKLALSVGLMNSEPGNTLQVIKDQMQAFKGEVGNFLGLSEVNKNPLNRNHVKQTFSMRFENCTLNVDLVTNPRTKTEVVQGFQLR